jgi:Na+/melibiose symporter-like transporter
MSHSNDLDIEKAEVAGALNLRRSIHSKENFIPVTELKNNLGSANKNDGEEESSLPLSKAKCIALVATVSGASFLNIVSLQSAVLILPTISRDLAIPESRQQWILSSYQLAFACFLLVWGRIADIYGKRSIFILGSSFVVLVTALNPLMPNEITFNLFRGLQGFVSWLA